MSSTASNPFRLRCVVVGAGVIGTHHAFVISQLSDQAELVAVADSSLEKAQRLASAYGCAAFGSLTTALDEVECDVVVACTPTGRHGDVAIEALRAGKHVIVEKPAETTTSRIDAIIEAQRQANRLVTVISQHRFDPSTELVLEAIGRGDLGRLTSGVAAIDWWRAQGYYDSGDWRGTWALDGGGALMNQGVHTLDLLMAALGKPVEVFAYTAALAHDRIDVEDVAVGVVKFESGALGVLHATTAAYPGLSARLHVYGDKGSAVIDNDSLTFIHTSRSGTELRETLPGGSTEVTVNQIERYPEAAQPVSAAGSDAGAFSDAHRRQYLNFVAALRGDEELRVTLETNRLSISVIEGVYESARTGMPVVFA